MAARKLYRMGDPKRACDVRRGDVVLVTPVGNKPTWQAARTLRDSYPLTITRVEYTKLGRQRTYRFHGTVRHMPGEVATCDFYGQNVLKAPVPREAAPSTAS